MMAMYEMFDAFDHSILKSVPLRLTPESAWHEHIPFAMYLVEVLKPRTIVELGTHTGDSYCAFCQSVKTLKLSTSCYAIDTWSGDGHTGSYGPEILRDLRAHHDLKYSGFSKLIQSTFDEALKEFGEGTIDLLHIDGFHTYEAVKHDWENWLSKVSDDGIILIHDTNEKREDFGVWKFWEEVRKKNKTFEFQHGHGLGVVAKGELKTNDVRKLFVQSPKDADRTRAIFEVLGQRVELLARVEALKKEVGQIELLKSKLEALQKEFERRTAWANQLNEENAKANKIVSALQKEFEERTLWAKSLDVDLNSAREYTARLQKEFEERTAWAEDLGARLTVSERKAHELQVWGEMIERQRNSITSSPIYKMLSFIGFLPKIKGS